MGKHRWRLAACIAVSAFVGVGMTSSPVGAATFPGTNGVIAYTQFMSSGAQILTVNPSTKQIANLSKKNYGDDEAAFSPKGTTIVFRSDGDIWTMSSAGASRKNLTPGGSGSYGNPEWSPDGTKIVYANNGNIGIMNADGSGQHLLTTINADDEPDWSPNGKTIAFRSYRDQDVARVFVMLPNGTKVKDLSSVTDPGFKYSDGEPQWSPDSTHLIFTSNRANGPIQAFEMTPTGTDVKVLTDAYTSVDSPVFSPGGKSIAYASGNGAGHVEVFTQVLGSIAHAQTTSQTNSIEGYLSWQVRPTAT